VIAYDALASPGRSLDSEARAFFEPRFGYDFSRVRIHADDRAANAAQAVQAQAYTLGNEIVFGAGRYSPATAQGKRLLAHELAHVVQQRGRAPAAIGPVTHLAQPAIQRDLEPWAYEGKLPKRGTFTLKGETVDAAIEGRKDPKGAYERVDIRFSPDAESPVTDQIGFIQTVHPPGVSGPGDLEKYLPDEKAKSQSATTAGASVHETRQGDTLSSVSQRHFGTTDKATEILQKNQGRLAWWSAAAGPQEDALTRALPAGTLLRIPGAVEGGVMVDVKGVQPKSKRDDPPVSPNYPPNFHSADTTKGALEQHPEGYKRANGSKHDVTMDDTPGGGRAQGQFVFETAAFAKDIGLIYGALKWGFSYFPDPGITSPFRVMRPFYDVVPTVSDTFNAAMASFNRIFRNKHIVQQGQTLNSISIQYYGSTNQAHSIYQMNPETLPKTYDPAAAIAGGTALEVGVGPTTGPSKLWDRPKEQPTTK